MNACTVEINGETWFIPCDRVNDLGLDQSNNLILLSSSSLTLYKTFEASNNSYPRISCSWGRVCTLQTAQSLNSYLTDVSLDVGHRSSTDSFFSSCMLGIICMGVVLWTLFRR